MKIRCVIGADNQMEYNSYVGHPSLWGDSYFSFEQQVDVAVENKAPLLNGGDLLNTPYPDSYTVGVLSRELRRLRDGQIPFLFVQGNHEYSRRWPWADIFDWGVHLHQKLWPFELTPGNWLQLYGIDYQPSSSLAAEMANIPKSAAVLMCHQAWTELMGTHLPSDGSLVELVPDHVRMVISGDYHAHRLLQLVNKNGAPFVLLSPGSGSLQSVKEDPVKYFYTIGEGLEQIQSVKLKTRTMISVEMIGQEQAEGELTKLREAAAIGEGRTDIPEHLRAPIWYVKVHDTLRDFLPKVEAAARGVAHLFPAPYGGKQDIEETAAPGSANFEEALHKELPDDSDLRASAVRLWRAADPKEEVGRLVEELLAPPAEAPKVEVA